MENSKFELIVTNFYTEAKDTVVIELQDPHRKALNAFTPGSHIEVHLSNGLIRHYSLVNSSKENHRYVIAVSLAHQGRGGSEFIHQQIRVGDLIKVTRPRNNFPLKQADEYCFIAGGIGITPIYSMIRWCEENNKKWRLIYALRNKQRASFYEELQHLKHNIHFHFNDDHDDQHLDVEQIIQSLSAKEHVYCCGPSALMQSVQTHAKHLSTDRIHFEWFEAAHQSVEQAKKNTELELDEFIVKIKSSGQEIPVVQNQSILEAFEQHGITLPFSCRSGICRTCETAVCSGVPSHHDFILSDEEHDSNQSILLCVSRSKTPVLELDL